MDPQDWDMDQLQRLAHKYGINNTTNLTKDELWMRMNDILDPEHLKLELYRWKRENLDVIPINFSDLPILSPTPDIEESYVRFSKIPILFPDKPEELNLQKQEILSKENLLKSKEKSLEERKAKIVSKEKRIKIRERKMARKIKQKEQILAAQKKQLLLQSKEKEKELSARENAIEKLREEAEQRKLELSEQKKQLDLKEKTLENLQREDIITKEELNSRERALEQQEDFLSNREQYLDKEEARILEKQCKIKEDTFYDDIYPFITVYNDYLVKEEAEIEEINFCIDKKCTRYTQADIPIEVRRQHQYYDCVKTVVCTTVEEIEKDVENITLLQLVYHSGRSEETYEIEIEDFVIIF